MAVPLSRHFPQPMMEYFVNDCDAKLLVTTSQYSNTMTELAKKTNKHLIVLEDSLRAEAMAHEIESTTSNEINVSDSLQILEESTKTFNNNRPALILYTSGSTGPPKASCTLARQSFLQGDILHKSFAVGPIRPTPDSGIFRFVDVQPE
ncbi:Acyl-CoA synthetase member 3, mitochondrial [Homalodisca vitripennis]|nr:Acyl-CoA synthetase member 3, mitochondrial [Homalodisca vitripennis]